MTSVLNLQSEVFTYKNELALECGETLSEFQLRYTTMGTLNEQRDNAVWVCHALTGNSNFTDWWKDFFDNNCPFDLAAHFFICANTIGGCYGSTGALSVNPKTNAPFYHDFPLVTTRDAVRAFDRLRQHLKIPKIHTLIGSSLGGQQALEWSIEQPSLFERLLVIAASAMQSPWGIAINEAQRMAIAADATWKEKNPDAGKAGMMAARAMGMVSFRSFDCFEDTQPNTDLEQLDHYRAASYQQYQGQKLANRFDAFTYWILSKMMDSHNVGRGRGGAEKALSQVKAKTLAVGIPSDILFPVAEQQFIAKHIPDATLELIASSFGHDGFLVEAKKMQSVIKKFLNHN